MNSFRRFACAGKTLLLLLLAHPAHAADMPVEISAARALEWNRAQKTYTALGDVVAKRGDAALRGEKLTAFYTGEGSGITRLVAEGGVAVSSPPYTAYGDRGTYTVDSGDAVLTGGNLRIETETERLTAKDKITYAAAQNTLTAEGGAVLVKDGRTLKAQTLTAFFRQGPDGKMATDRVTARGDIVIETGTETVTGNAGTYHVATQQAELTGNVVIRQGDSRLEGTRATVDMRTGISKLFADGNTETEGRVKGVFFPKKKEAQ